MYQLTPKVTIYNINEPMVNDGIYIVPHEANVHPWWSSYTVLILNEMAQLNLKNTKVLDFGCGSVGILGLVAKLFGASHVDFVDNNPKIAELANLTLKANGLDSRVYSEPTDNNYDFVFANVGNSDLVDKVSKLSRHGIGTDQTEGLIIW